MYFGNKSRNNGTSDWFINQNKNGWILKQKHFVETFCYGHYVTLLLILLIGRSANNSLSVVSSHHFHKQFLPRRASWKLHFVFFNIGCCYWFMGTRDSSIPTHMNPNSKCFCTNILLTLYSARAIRQFSARGQRPSWQCQELLILPIARTYVWYNSHNKQQLLP